ncbi:MAG: acetate--CoA ligase family protein [Thiolinea sp.]
MNLKRLLRPESIAVVGGHQAAEVIRQCQKMGYDGQIWPIHPKKDEVAGLPVFRSVDDLPAAPDATFIGVNRRLTIGIVEALAKRGSGGAVCYASGFLEADAEGGELQGALLEAAGEMPVLGPNCYGFINYGAGALLWPDQHGGRCLAQGEKGVALITQSSNLAINLTMQQRGLPITYILTAGNQAQVGLSQLALTALEDPQVTALGMHIEGFDSIAGMEKLAARARELNKPVVALKVGKSVQAQQATMTHTASLAGSHAASAAFLQRLGIGQVDSIPGLMESLKLLHVHGPLNGYRLCSMSCSGGEASLMADAVQGRKVYYPALNSVQKAPVEAVLGELVTVDNPLDYHTYIWGDEAGMQAVYQSMMEIGFDLSVLLLDFPHPERCDDRDWIVALRAFKAAVKASGAKAAITATLPENIPEPYITELMQQGVVAISGSEEVVTAAEVAADIGIAWQQPQAAALPAFTVSGQSAGVGDTLHEDVAKQLLSEYGIAVPQGCRIDSPAAVPEAIAIFGAGRPLVAKQLGIAHKTEDGGVRLNLRDQSQILSAVTDLLNSGHPGLDTPAVLLEAMVQDVVGELIIGVVRDQQFGWVLTLGAGGIWVEVLKDTATLLIPARRSEIETALAGLKVAPLFQGYRGAEVGDMATVVETVMKVQDLVMARPDLLELDINPLMVCAQNQGAWAADALIVLDECQDRRA